MYCNQTVPYFEIRFVINNDIMALGRIKLCEKYPGKNILNRGAPLKKNLELSNGVDSILILNNTPHLIYIHAVAECMLIFGNIYLLPMETWCDGRNKIRIGLKGVQGTIELLNFICPYTKINIKHNFMTLYSILEATDS